MFNSYNVCVPGTAMPAPQIIFNFSFCAVFLLVLLLSGFGIAPATLQAQSGITWTDLDSFKIGYEVEYDGATIPANAHYDVKMYLETASGIEATGASFELLYPSGCQLDVDYPYSVPGKSWLGLSNELYVASLDSPTVGTAEFSLLREDNQGQSGSGWVLTAHFVNGSQALARSAAVATMGGGIVIGENIDLKVVHTTENQVADPIQVYPNPFVETIQVQTGGQVPLQIRIRSLSGQVVARRRFTGAGSWNLRQLPAGTYLLEAEGKSGDRYIRRLVKR